MAVEQGLQQLKSARARDSICKATIQLLAELGYAETTIAGVAQNAGFSKGAVQFHFPTKEELIAAADLVTEMTLVKHPFRDGIKAQKGVEF